MGAALAVAGGAVLVHVEMGRVGTTSTRGSTAGDPLATQPFTCGGSTGLGVSAAPAVAFVNSVGVSERQGFDRVTFGFRNGRPRDVVVATQDTATFTAGAGPATVLKGSRGATITIYNSDARSDYHGPTDIQTRYSAVLELREIGASSGSVEWAVGLSGAPCYRVAFYDNPVALVADFRRS